MLLTTLLIQRRLYAIYLTSTILQVLLSIMVKLQQIYKYINVHWFGPQLRDWLESPLPC